MPTHKPVLIDDLYGELILPSGDERWMVVHTKPRCEKKLAEYAKRNGIWYYLPQMDSKRLYEKRLVTFTKPMFPGYLFTMLDMHKKQILLLTGYTVFFIKVTNQQQLLDELANIHLSHQPKVELEQALWLSKGLEVEIIKGPLKGVTGVVENHKKLTEVRLQVNILRQAVLVKVNPSDVKILGEYTIVDEEEEVGKEEEVEEEEEEEEEVEEE